MKFLADECVAADIVGGLRSAGHDVRYIAEKEQGASDLRVLEVALRDGRVLITEDKDFAAAAALRGGPGFGVISYRLDALRRENVAARVLAAVGRIGESALDHLTIIMPDRIRSRRLATR
jgi:predicted nuclease of predicted toxin-antitoxin system